MSQKTIQEILPLVERPSRYLGSEINAAASNKATARLRVALAFPDLYEIGTSHFGLQILYHILNRHGEIVAERVFTPAADMAALLRSSDMPLTSLESRTPLKNFDIIGFSLLYELNYTNILTILELSQIPFLANQRDETFPLVIGGGPCTCNPEPVAELFDALVVGDGEDVMVEMSLAWLEWKSGDNKDKKTLLKSWSAIEGVYIPAFFRSFIDDQGLQGVVPIFPHNSSIKRAVVEDLNEALFPNAPIVPYGKPVHDRLRIEVSRGCTSGCRFCQAGMIYRPVRERSLTTLFSLCDASITATGYEDISLLSLSTGDYTCIGPLLEGLMNRYESEHISVSLPSLRANTLTSSLMNQIKKVRKTGFTIAPEAGSQRLRDVINKNITDEEIENAVKNAFGLGWHSIKLYFMVGLPSETDDDLQAIVDLIKKLKKIKASTSAKGAITVSVATFVPKPHTPFQWHGQIPLEASKHKIRWLQRKLKLPGVQVKWQNPEVSIIEGLWARGDRRLSQLLLAAFRKGCRFDGWSDTFRYSTWLEAAYETGVDIDFYTTRHRDRTERLPWDHIDTRVTKNFLLSEMIKAANLESTADCRLGDCQGCGVCDVATIEPRLADIYMEKDRSTARSGAGEAVNYRRIRVSYSKLGQARFFGHIELMKIFSRAIRRADMAIKFSKGFHPKPKLSFVEALPVGMESQEERFYFFISVHEPLASVKTRLNKHLPDGIKIIDCRPAPRTTDQENLPSASYEVILEGGIFDEKELESFKKKRSLVLLRRSGKKRTTPIDLKAVVLSIDITAQNKLNMTLQAKPGKMVRPGEVIKNIFSMSQEKIKQARILKLRALR